MLDTGGASSLGAGGMPSLGATTATDSFAGVGGLSSVGSDEEGVAMARPFTGNTNASLYQEAMTQ